MDELVNIHSHLNISDKARTSELIIKLPVKYRDLNTDHP